jgi:hypothetical protein
MLKLQKKWSEQRLVIAQEEQAREQERLEDIKELEEERKEQMEGIVTLLESTRMRLKLGNTAGMDHLIECLRMPLQ